MNGKNLVSVAGNIAAEPQLRQTNNGTPVVEFPLAMNRRRSASGTADFIRVEAYGDDAKNLSEYKAKGHGISVVGRLDYQSWNDKETGELRSTVKVVANKGGITYLPKGSAISSNHVELIGNLTRDPETLKVGNGIDKANFGVAIDGLPMEDGETDTDYFNCVSWRGLAGIVGQYKEKGDMVQIQGRISSSSWKDKTTGNTRSKIEITVENIEFFPNNRPDASAPAAANEEAPAQEEVPAEDYYEVTEEDLQDVPF